MSVNNFKPHLLVLPEDDANRQLANGFVLEVRDYRQIQILPEAGGWSNVVNLFVSEYVKAMRKYPARHLVLLLDFDDHSDRAAKVQEQVPQDLRDRVYLLGTRSEPEKLKQAGLGSFQDIGRNLARECRDGIQQIWSHDLLAHNDGERTRLEANVRSFLF